MDAIPKKTITLTFRQVLETRGLAAKMQEAVNGGCARADLRACNAGKCGRSWAYSLSDRMPDDLVQQAFFNAWSESPGSPGALFHPD